LFLEEGDSKTINHPSCACGFIPKHSCQLDVDHINNNHKDNIESNLHTLCSNCHRLKSMLERKKNDKNVSSKN
jgi:5-methylcytosine-specific restriction endonuclease McrA